ncbi:hypothetical protein Tco_1143102 [Tanacetum coccineum]
MNVCSENMWLIFENSLLLIHRRIDPSIFLTKITSAPHGDELGLINPLLRSSCSFLDSSCISDGAKGYGALATVAAYGTRSIRN